MNQRTIFVVLCFLGIFLICFIERITPHPKYAQVFYDIGLDAEKKGDSVEALNNYEKVVKFDPTFPPVYNRLGMIAFKRGDLSKAIENLELAVNLDPGFYEAYFHLGLVYLHTQSFDRAVVVFRRAISLNNVLYRFYLGVAYLNTGKISYALDVADDLGNFHEPRLEAKLKEMIKMTQSEKKK